MVVAVVVAVMAVVSMSLHLLKIMWFARVTGVVIMVLGGLLVMVR